MWINDLKHNETYEFAFLKIDIVEHSRITREGPYQEIEKVFDDFEKYYVEEHVPRRNGMIWGWQGDGGLCAFWGKDTTEKARNAYNAAHSILAELDNFNDNNPLPRGNRVRVRVAAHLGNARYRGPQALGRIHSEAINFVAHLENQRTHVNSISISHEVYKELTDDMQKRFEPIGEFEGKKIYTNDKERKDKFGPGFEFYFRRQEIPRERRLPEVLYGIRQTVYIKAITFSVTLHEGLEDYLHEALKRNSDLQIRFLVFDPDSPHVDFVLGPGTTGTIHTDLSKQSILGFYRIITKLKETFNDQVDFVCYRSLPRTGIWIVDPKLPHAWAKIELYLFEAQAPIDRPNIFFSRDYNPQYFDKLYTAIQTEYDELKKEQTAVERTTSVTPAVVSLVKLREQAVHNLLNRPVQSDLELRQWERDVELWEKSVLSVLKDCCTPDEVSRFEVLGMFLEPAFGWAYNPEHNRWIAMLQRHLEILMGIVERIERR